MRLEQIIEKIINKNESASAEKNYMSYIISNVNRYKKLNNSCENINFHNNLPSSAEDKRLLENLNKYSKQTSEAVSVKASSKMEKEKEKRNESNISKESKESKQNSFYKVKLKDVENLNIYYKQTSEAVSVKASSKMEKEKEKRNESNISKESKQNSFLIDTSEIKSQNAYYPLINSNKTRVNAQTHISSSKGSSI